MEFKKILITGANGFVGTNLAEHFTQKGYKVFALVRASAKVQHLKELGCEIIVGDVLNPILVRESLKKVDIAFHLAGMGLNRLKAASNKQFNQESTKIICEEAEKIGKEMDIVLLSSIKVYEASSENRKKKEDEAYGRTDSYGKSKGEAERIAINVCKSTKNLKLLIVRAPFIIGKGDNNTKILFKMKESKIKLKIGGKLSKSSYISVKELCDLLEEICIKQTKKIEIVNVGYKTPVDINQIIDEIYKGTEKSYIGIVIPGFLLYIAVKILEKLNIKPFLQPERVLDMTKYNWIADTEYIESTYGFTCRCNLEECLK